MKSNSITPEMAQMELARREAARNELSRRESERNNQIDYITGRNRTPIDLLRDLTKGALTGVGEAVQTIGNSFRTPSLEKPKNDFNVEEFFSPIASPNKSIGGEIAQGIGEYVPYAIAGGPSLLGQIIAGGAHGAMTAQPNQRNLFGILPEGKTGAAIEGAGLNVLGHGLGKLIENLRPSRLFRGNLSANELEANLNAAGGTKAQIANKEAELTNQLSDKNNLFSYTPDQIAQEAKTQVGTPTGLGDIIESPFLKRQYENVLSKLPLSGATDKLQKAGIAVNERGNKILSDLLGKNNPSTVTDDLTNALKNKSKIQEEKKIKLYDHVNDLAKKEKLSLELPNFSQKAQEFSDAIETTNILKYEPDIQYIFNKLKNYKNPVEIIPSKLISSEGKPLTVNKKTPTLKEANLLKGKFNNYAEQLKVNPDPEKRGLEKVFRSLSSALKDDINHSIDLSGNKTLKQAYDLAEHNYKVNFSPFLDKDIYKFTHGNADTDLLTQNFLKISRGADRGKVLLKLSNQLSDKEKKLLAYSYFSRSLDNEGNLNPAKLATSIRQLGKNQFKALIPDSAMRKEIKNYEKLYTMNTKAVNLMQNPATGQQNLDILPGMLAHAGAGIAGGALGGPAGAIAGLVAPGLMARPAVNWMTNPRTREALIKAMIENKQWDKTLTPAIQTGAQGAINR